MEETKVSAQSKYLKPEREEKVFFFAAVVFFFTLFVLPQYFGIPFPLFDLTVLRIMIIIIVFMIIADNTRKRSFVKLIKESAYTKILVPYLLVLCYTMVLRADINALLNPFIEILSFYLITYIIKDVFGMERTVRYIIYFSYLLTILGVIEYLMGRSFFSYLETINGLYTGEFVRSGYYRIMGPCNHSLGYGLLLVTITPISCINFKKNEISFSQNFILLILIAINVFLCGSRSTLSVFILEIFLLILFSSKEQRKKFILIGMSGIMVFGVFLYLCRNTSVGQYILLQITTIIDEMFDTAWSVQFGANTTALESSSNYRAQLKYIFQLDWLNPILGIGRKRSFSAEINGSYIRSLDNFYIAEYIRYAYPGMITYIIFILYFLVNIFKKWLHVNSGICKALFIGTVCYFVNLLWLDSLQTLKYVYVLFSLYCVLDADNVTKPYNENAEAASKYFRK